MGDQSFTHALGILPASLRGIVQGQRLFKENDIEEIRLRSGRALALSSAGAERVLPNTPPVTAAQLNQVMENVTRSSLHTAAESIKRGYVTSIGGCRIGLCGTAAVTAGAIGSIRELSSICIRIAREHKGIAGELLPRLLTGGRIRSTLVISPPGYGKTTLLRDMVRLLSDRGVRISIADERGEIAAVHGGLPRFDVGCHTDVFTGAPKEQAVMTLLRTMTPQVIALDEISEAADAGAVELAANCGVSLFSTVHGVDKNDVFSRPVFQDIRARGIFRTAVTIGMEGGRRSLRVEEI